jgi:hypothetical protein
MCEEVQEEGKEQSKLAGQTKLSVAMHLGFDITMFLFVGSVENQNESSLTFILHL